ncbi:MAG: hypothetical protein IPM66_18145 [Acidobacteriota bacterium]|nr:MAG: hypothetical protein IPM66_18145 [Acidobacteriota bacterium]
MAILPASSVPTRLLRAVVAKTAVELALLCLIATVAAFWNFSPLLRGAVDVADRTRVAGWAYDPQAPSEAVEVQVFIDGKFARSSIAGAARPDLVAAGAAQGPDHGFSVPIDDLELEPGTHAVQVYAVRSGPGNSKILAPLSRSPLELMVEP